MSDNERVVVKTEIVKRLTPTPEVLRELYLLSGNNCAIPDCRNIIIDYKGVVVGHICHIEAAMPGGPRFNKAQTNEERRSIDNLILACSGHHALIDSKQHESTWTVERLKKIKYEHENSFKGGIDSLQKVFHEPYKDSTDYLFPTLPSSFQEFNKQIPGVELEGKYKDLCVSDLNKYVEKLSKVPNDVRRFMAAILKRSFKLDDSSEYIGVHIDDVRQSLSINKKELYTLGQALERYGVGNIDLMAVGDNDETYIFICNPSEYLFWGDINEFCKKSNFVIDDFVIDIDFGLLD